MSTTLIEQGVPFTDWRARLQQRMHTARSHDGFSLLELVVAVSIMLILAVVGFIAYQGLTDNAREAAVESAAQSVYTGALAEWHNPGPTDLQSVADGYNESADGITATITPASDDASDICVVAQNDDHEQFVATRGDCEDVDVPGDGEDE